MSLSLTLKTGLLWKQTHISLFLPGRLLRAGSDCRELRFVPCVRLDAVHGVERNHTSGNMSTHNYWMASGTLRSLSPSSSQPSGLCGPCYTRTIQPSRCCLSGPAANRPWWDKCAEEDWQRSTLLAVHSTNTHALLHMHCFSNFCQVSAFCARVESTSTLFSDSIVCIPNRIFISQQSIGKERLHPSWES